MLDVLLQSKQQPKFETEDLQHDYNSLNVQQYKYSKQLYFLHQFHLFDRFSVRPKRHTVLRKLAVMANILFSDINILIHCSNCL